MKFYQTARWSIIQFGDTLKECLSRIFARNGTILHKRSESADSPPKMVDLDMGSFEKQKIRTCTGPVSGSVAGSSPEQECLYVQTFAPITGSLDVSTFAPAAEGTSVVGGNPVQAWSEKKE